MELNREFLKQLWNNEKVLCPKCNEAFLIPLHKGKKNKNDWQCLKCKEVYRTINLFNKLLEDNR